MVVSHSQIKLSDKLKIRTNSCSLWISILSGLTLRNTPVIRHHLPPGSDWETTDVTVVCIDGTCPNPELVDDLGDTLMKTFGQTPSDNESV